MNHFVALAVSMVLPLAASADELKESFRDPPREYSLMPLWSWNSTLTPGKLTWQIDQMVEKGVYGAFMHTRAGLNESATPYFSDGFWEAVRVSVEHAAQAGFQTWIYDEDRWPSGAAGGRTMRANPERYTATGLKHESRPVKGPTRQILRHPSAKFLIAAKSTGENRIDRATLIDLTSLKDGGAWDVPAGEWLLCVFHETHGDYPLPNYINPDAIREFLNNTYEQYAARFGKHFGTTIPGSFFDEIGNIPLAWDPLLAERFRNAKGYDLEKVLPLLYHEGGAGTIQTRCDYFEVLTKLYEDAWFRQISEWCARHNLKLTGHTNETLRHVRDQGDYFRTWRHAQIPGTDNEDFRYTFPRVIGAWKPKQLSSISHLYGKPRAAVEALGGAGWPITLEEARYGVNMLAAYGMNFYIFHLFHYAMDQPQSMDDWPNSWFYENPYWKYFKKLADHVRRLSFLGSQGAHVADVAVLYPVEEIWSRGIPDDPLTGDSAPVTGLVDRLMEEQIDCDLVDTDSVIGAAPAEGGRARIGIESYRVVVLPGVQTVSLAAYRRMAGLSRQGLKIVAVGVVPRHSAERGEDDPEVIRISRELFHAGALRHAGELVPFLRDAIEPDIRVLAGPANALRYLHRRIGHREAYFLVNSERRPVEWTVRFAAAGSVERWDPETGATAAIPALDTASSHSTLRLRFRPWQAYYVVFDRSAPAARAPPSRQPGLASLPPLELTGPWTFQVVPKELDYVWKADAGEAAVELPVMDMSIERGPDRFWRRVKITDPASPRKGAARYLSAWDAYWITRYSYQRHFGELGGAELRFRATISLPFEPSGSWLAIAADERFECVVNGAAVPRPAESLPLKRGANTIEITVRGKGYLLAQGEIAGPNGERLPIRTDRNWQVKAPEGGWVQAYEFASPPFGAWGDLPLRGKKQGLQAVVWYRAVVPPGARWMDRPDVLGGFEARLDGKLLSVPSSGGIRLPEYPPGALLALKTQVDRADGGLRQPLVFRCGPLRAALGDWRELGLDWYSGRGLYRTAFQLPREYLGRRLILDLGDLRYTGEVWLNGRLVDSLAWPPYQADISRFVAAGGNELVVVAANLLANRMRWDIFDSAIPSQFSRWWHDGSILREADHLRSGLLGPVRIRVED